MSSRRPRATYVERASLSTRADAVLSRLAGREFDAVTLTSSVAFAEADQFVVLEKTFAIAFLVRLGLDELIADINAGFNVNPTMLPTVIFVDDFVTLDFVQCRELEPSASARRGIS